MNKNNDKELIEQQFDSKNIDARPHIVFSSKSQLQTPAMQELLDFAKQPRGAKRKAEKFEEAFFASRNKHSELSKVLLELWRWGHIPATLVQKIALAAHRDLQNAHGLQINAWLELSQLGSCGEHINNIHRDLVRWVPQAMFEVCQCAVPLQISATKGLPVQTAFRRLPMIMPRTLWYALWQSAHFKNCILNDAEALPGFWTACGQHPGLHNHPVKTVPNYQKRAVPLVLHGDGAAVTMQIGSNSKSCLFLSFRSLVARQQRHFFMAAIWTLSCVKGQSFNTAKSVFRIIATSFQSLWDCKDTGGFFPVLLWTTGDLEYFADFHHIARWNSTQPCCLCNVNKQQLERVPPLESLALKKDIWQLPRHHPCPLFSDIVSPLCIAADYMHTKHLGCDLRLLGSVAWMMLFSFPSTVSLEHRLQALLHEAKVSWPKLRFNTFKTIIYYLFSLFVSLDFRNFGHLLKHGAA